MEPNANTKATERRRQMFQIVAARYVTVGLSMTLFLMAWTMILMNGW
jgi:hypothetical protein